MSEENVELVRQTFAGWGDTEEARRAFLEEAGRSGRIAPDAELDFTAMYPDAPVVHGVEAWLGYFRSMPWGGSVKLAPERFFDVDDERVLVFVRVTAQGEGSGAHVEIRNAYEFTIRDGAIVRWKVFADRAAALEAAGLSS
jgi:ketosteroid isomerase-like protein